MPNARQEFPISFFTLFLIEGTLNVEKHKHEDCGSIRIVTWGCGMSEGHYLHTLEPSKIYDGFCYIQELLYWLNYLHSWIL